MVDRIVKTAVVLGVIWIYLAALCAWWVWGE